MGLLVLQQIRGLGSDLVTSVGLQEALNRLCGEGTTYRQTTYIHRDRGCEGISKAPRKRNNCSILLPAIGFTRKQFPTARGFRAYLVAAKFQKSISIQK